MAADRALRQPAARCHVFGGAFVVESRSGVSGMLGGGPLTILPQMLQPSCDPVRSYELISASFCGARSRPGAG